MPLDGAQHYSNLTLYYQFKTLPGDKCDWKPLVLIIDWLNRITTLTIVLIYQLLTKILVQSILASIDYVYWRVDRDEVLNYPLTVPGP
jgi:hypothetical protein